MSRSFQRRSRIRLALALVPLVALAGCRTPSPAGTPASVSECLAERSGHGLCQAGCGRAFFVPPQVTLDDGLSEDEAIAIALCNNAAFQELLVDLRLANADLIQAGLLPNPEVGYFFPVSEKPYKYLVDFPVESLWLRPIRVRAASGEVARTRDRLVQAGLNLIRDVRLAYCDVLLAQAQAKVGQESIGIRGRIAAVAEARLRAGDVSPQEVATARIDSLQATQDATRLQYQVNVALERLRGVLGMGQQPTPLLLAPAPLSLLADLDADGLVALAVDSRPDLVAAAEATAAAQERLRLAQVGWIRLLGIADATSGRGTGHELGPAFRTTLPIFNWNEGGIARAEGEVERASRQWQTLRDQVVLDVRQAYFQYEQARTELDWLKQRVRPEVELAIERSQTAYREGNTSYLLVLEATRQLLDSYLREAQLETNLRRAAAELERGVGRRLTARPPSAVEELPPVSSTPPPADSSP